MPEPRRPTVSTLALVAVGGAVGTAARAALTLAYPAGDAVPYAVFGINVAGAFLLGWLASALGVGPTSETAPATAFATVQRRRVYALVGTGALGGFTTYSALAVDASLLFEGNPAVGFGYAIASVIVGVAAAGLGLWLGARLGVRPRGRAA